jgi:hypothetical protein
MECGHLNGGKSKAVIYAFPPGYRENAEEEEEEERKVNSLPPLGFEPVIFGMLAHLSNHSAKSHPL